MSRLPDLVFEDLSLEQQRVYQLIKERRGAVRGPFAIWLTLPEVAEHCLGVQHLLNYDSCLDKRIMQLTILLVARQTSAQFAWFIHARHAKELGIDDDVIEAIRTNQLPSFDRDDEKIAYDLVMEICQTKTLSETSFTRGLAAFGQEQIVELVVAIGFYGLVSLTLNVFDARPPGNARPFD